jgi:hypothetical protein
MIRNPQRITVATNGFCVYSHSYRNKVFYVGHGSAQRPFSSIRNAFWKKYIEKYKVRSYDITIHLWTSTKEKARLEESRLRRELKPVCNILENESNPVRERLFI